MAPIGLNTQRLWLVRWGTQSALVWAQHPENAELRVRHGVFRRGASTAEVTSRSVAIRGDVVVLREATDEDKAAWEIAGGEVPA